MTNEEIIINGLKAGNAKNVILTELVRNDADLDLTKAGALIKQVGTDNNLILDNEAKDSLTAEVADQFTADGKLGREAAVTALMERGAMTKTAAVNRLKTYCANSDIEFPQASRASRDMDAVKNAYKTWFDGGETREAIEAGLIEHFGYTEKNVKQAYLKIGKELGLIEASVSTGRAELAAWFAVPENVEGDKAAIVSRLMESTGVAKATAETRYNMYLFAVEYQKQAA